MHHPKSAKSPLLATKWTKNVVFVGGLRGVRFKKITFLVQNVHFLGVPQLPKIDPGYRPAPKHVHKLTVSQFSSWMEAKNDHARNVSEYLIS